MRGNGLVAVRMHTIAGFDGRQSVAGSDPFGALAFAVQGGQVTFKEYMTSGWQAAQDVAAMSLNEVGYDLRGMTNHTFSNLFPIYDWQADNGFANLGTWIEKAARQAGL